MMNTANELIRKEIEKNEVKEYDPLVAEFNALRKETEGRVPDASNKEGYDFCKDISGRATTLISNIESTRKDLKKPALDFGRLIDSQAKELTSIVQLTRDSYRDAYREVDRIKKERKEKIAANFESIKSIVSDADGKTSSEIMSMIDEWACYDVSPENFGKNGVDEAVTIISTSLETLQMKYGEAIQKEEEEAAEAARIEAERLELEQLRKEKEERAQREREENERIRHEEELRQAAETARIETEKKAEEARLMAEKEKQYAIEAAKRAETARIKAEQEAKQLAEEAAKRAREQEIERQKAEELERIKEQELREANKRHCAKINNAAVFSLIAECGLSEEQAKVVITAIAKRQIKNVLIQY